MVAAMATAIATAIAKAMVMAIGCCGSVFGHHTLSKEWKEVLGFSSHLTQGRLDAVYSCGLTGCAAWAQKLSAIYTGPRMQEDILCSSH